MAMIQEAVALSSTSIRAWMQSSAWLSDIQVRQSVTSTNDVLLQSSAEQPVLCIAETQTSGRGCRGKSWIDEPGAVLCASLLWPTQGAVVRNSTALSLAVGVAICRALRKKTNKLIVLKWPNDVLYQACKLGGILIEYTQSGQLVIGIGINMHLSQAMCAAIDQPATSLSRILGAAADRNQVMAGILDELLICLQQFDHVGLVSFQSEWNALNAYRDQQVVYQSNGVSVSGRCHAIDSTGALVIETDNGYQRIETGELISSHVHTGA